MNLIRLGGDCHTRTRFGTRRQIRQHGLVLVIRAPFGTFLFGQSAHDAHTASAVIPPVQILLGAAPSARREGTLVTEAEFPMFCTLSAAVAAHLTICEAFRELVFKVGSDERAGDVFRYMYSSRGRWYGGMLGGRIMVLRWLVP